MHGAAFEDLGVVPGRHRVKAQSPGAIEEHVELDVPIAFDARIGRRTLDVALHERLDHVAIELLGVIKDVMVDTKNLGDASRVVHVSD